MIRKIILFVIYALAALLLVLPLACGGGVAEEAPGPTAGAQTDVAETPAATSIPEGEAAEAEPTSLPEEDAESTPITEVAAEAIVERTPLPTPVPGPVDELITDFTVATGLAGKSFLGLTADDWINLVISGLIVLFGYQLGRRVLKSLFLRLVRRTATRFDDEFLEVIERELRWFVVLVLVWAATFRLGFLSDSLRRSLTDLYFTAGLAICTLALSKLVEFGRHDEDARRHGAEPFVDLGFKVVGLDVPGHVGLRILRGRHRLQSIEDE